MIAMLHALIWGLVSVFGIAVAAVVAVVIGALVVADRMDKRWEVNE